MHTGTLWPNASIGEDTCADFGLVQIQVPGLLLTHVMGLRHESAALHSVFSRVQTRWAHPGSEGVVRSR